MDNPLEVLIYIIIIISFISSFFKKKKPQQKNGQEGQNADSNIPNKNVFDEIKSTAAKLDTNDDFDLSKEMENFFKVGQQENRAQPVNQIDETKQKIEPRKGFLEVPEDSFHTTTSSEHSFSKSIQKEREGYKRVPEKSFHQQSASEHTFRDPWETGSEGPGKDYKRVPEKSFHQLSASEHEIKGKWDTRLQTSNQRKRSTVSTVPRKTEKYERFLKVKETAASDIILSIKKRLSDPTSLKEYIIISEIIGKPKALRR